ncbi:probable disease resistance protein At4g27220 [Coffea eugenioides]|uniref:probable disease resistance protein At4g27220 n=1 Tax=Coffea eugenioides TaxID=49369 RepID=UPI000F60498E|nr:probable disease resistance protein At4g27220 [Coffea eugenioides]
MAETSGLFNKVIFAVVSRNLDVRKIQGRIGDMLGLYFREESEMGRAGRLFERLTTQERILLVLDDVWNFVNFKEIGIPVNFEGKGCKIMITTRQRNLCSTMGLRKTKEIPLRLLSDEESWNLFKSNAGSLADTFSPQQDDVTMKVARECCGLPLALVTVGRALRNKDLELWRAALQQLKKSKPLNINYNEKDIFSCLKLSYDQLQSEEAKDCFLSCCLFPEDHDIKIEDIARYALGKGMFTDVETMEEARRETRWIIRNLTDCCLLLDSSTEDSVRMHDMVRDFAISMASTGEHGFVIKAGLGLKEWPNQETLERNAVIISLMTNHIQSLPDCLICPKLEILLLAENEVFEVIPEGFFLGMPTLRVLDLSEKIGARSLNRYFEPDKWTSMPSSSFKLPSSFEALVNLRTLHLNHCKLDDVAVLGKLKRLEVLSFYGCDIEELPKEIGELVNLRLLDLNFCQKLKTVPATLLLRLCQLEELYMWESFHQWAIQGMVEDTSKACLSEITSLSHLTTLCIQVSNPESVPRKLHIPNVQKFEIVIGKGYDSVTCYPNSRSLSLREIKTSIPEGVKDILQNTEDLRLFCLYDEMIRNILDVDLGTLNNLRYLKVVACMETSFLLSMNQSANDAPAILAALESLHLQLMNELFVICPKLLPVGSLHKLKFLKLQSCKRMWVAITATLLQRLLSLEEVEATWCKQMSSVFDLGNISSENQQFLLSNLRIIRLHGLESLRTIWKGGVKPLPPSVRLAKLTVVELSSCGSLKVIFPYSIAQNLLQLEVLKINWCNKLESIVEKRPEVSVDQYQLACFPNLRIIEVSECSRLRKLFSVAEARYLQQLKEINISSCKDIVELISHDEEGEEDTEDKRISLPELYSMKIKDMSNINRLCAMSFSVDLPSLEQVVLEKCPNMEEFNSDPQKYGVGHAPKLKERETNLEDKHQELELLLKHSEYLEATQNTEHPNPYIRCYSFIYIVHVVYVELWITTECDRLQVVPGEIVVIPLGFHFVVDLPDGSSHGYVAEIFGTHFQLLDLGQMGAAKILKVPNGLAAPRDFLAPMA